MPFSVLAMRMDQHFGIFTSEKKVLFVCVIFLCVCVSLNNSATKTHRICRLQYCIILSKSTPSPFLQYSMLFPTKEQVGLLWCAFKTCNSCYTHTSQTNPSEMLTFMQRQSIDQHFVCPLYHLKIHVYTDSRPKGTARLTHRTSQLFQSKTHSDKCLSPHKTQGFIHQLLAS